MRILLADDQPTVRSAMRLLLEQQPEANVVEEVTNAQELVDHVSNSYPDILLLDWKMAGHTPKQLFTILRDLCPDTFIIALDSRPQTRKAALDAGTNVFVSKNDPPERLMAAVMSAKVNINGASRLNHQQDRK